LNESTAMTIEQIKEYLPHRYPFLLIDRVLECQPPTRIVAIKNVSINEEFFTGHFPHYHVMPGVLVVEGMAQAAAILSFKTLDVRPDKKSVYYFAGIDSARFKRPVVPGDQIRYEITAGRSIRGIAKFSGIARVDDLVVAEAELLCAYRQVT
jgi:3-hydroxyacyl-[acyl-carrier-protein] dehydratase